MGVIWLWLLGRAGRTVFVDFAVSVALDDELGSGVAEFEALGGPVDGEFLLKDELNQLKTLLNGRRGTFSEM